jgi:hypothetical protein
MRYSSVIPFAIAVAAACHDGPMAPAISELVGRGHSGSAALTVTQTAQGVWEQRTEYDWTAQRYVSEIHVGSDMHLIPERDRVQILPGETVWIMFQVDAQRRVAFEGTVEGVRGQTCITNTGAARVDGISILEQVEVRSGSNWVPVAGATAVVTSTAALEKGESLCLPYEILFDAESGAAYRVVATVTTNRGGTGASAGFALPSEKSIVEIDAEARVRDQWWDACQRAFGLDFSCLSPDTFPRDRLLEANAAGNASVSFMVDIRNDGICGETIVYTIDEPLREGGPSPPGGEIRSVVGSVVITTGRCEDLTTCPKSDEWWAARLASHRQEVSSLLPIVLGIQHGSKTLSVVSVEIAEAMFNRYGDASNGILELYAQLLTAKLNIKIGVDPRPTRDVRIAADVFLESHHSTDWPSLTASEQAQVRELARELETINERGCESDDDDDSPGTNCTRTIGYWKNHAGFGPQNDEVTRLLPVWLGTAGGSRSVQVTTAALAVEFLNMSGDASNGVNKLYAQLLAAKLNIKRGADGSAVLETITQADAFLATHGSADWNALSSGDRQRVLAWATMLDDYNNGKIGPGQCH